ncbi:hypothetical protein [Hwanghaeella sp.]|uniref:hypothetical protein n=1 Tax=Hwanghaeella sp. TaxID=2605943 RepID=UPI003CCBE0CF
MSTGILALWNNREAAHADEYEDWYKKEHFPERLGIPGILRGRRYEAEGARQRFFTYYETETPETLTSPAYLERLENPTDWTRRVMNDVMRDMSRTVCKVARREGGLRGAFAIAVRLNSAEGADDVLNDPEILARTIRRELWVSAEAGNEQTAEEKLRGGDEKIAACIMVETLRQADAEAVLSRLNNLVGSNAQSGEVYRFLCELESGSV